MKKYIIRNKASLLFTLIFLGVFCFSLFFGASGILASLLMLPYMTVTGSHPHVEGCIVTVSGVMTQFTNLLTSAVISLVGSQG